MAARLTLKNSNVQFKNATAAQIGNAELGLNYHSSGPYLQCKDSAGRMWSIGGVHVSAEAPLNPILGRQWLNTGNNRLYIYTGASWIGTQTLNFEGDPEFDISNWTTAQLKLDEPSTKYLPSSVGLATQKDLNQWLNSSLTDLETRLISIEQADGGGGDVNLSEYARLDGADFTGDISVTGSAHIDGYLEVDGYAKLKSAEIKDDLDVGGDVEIEGDIKTKDGARIKMQNDKSKETIRLDGDDGSISATEFIGDGSKLTGLPTGGGGAVGINEILAEGDTADPYQTLTFKLESGNIPEIPYSKEVIDFEGSSGLRLGSLVSYYHMKEPFSVNTENGETSEFQWATRRLSVADDYYYTANDRGDVWASFGLTGIQYRDAGTFFRVNSSECKWYFEDPEDRDAKNWFELNVSRYDNRAELFCKTIQANEFIGDDGTSLQDRIQTLEEQIVLLASLVPPVDYGRVTITGGNDNSNNQCWLSPNETGVFICWLSGTQTHGCKYSWSIARGEGRFSGSTIANTVTFICQSEAPSTVVLRCDISHPTTDEMTFGELTILVQPADN